MGFRTICDCDACGSSIDATDELPARVNVYPPTPRDVGHQQDEHHLCRDCWAKLCAAFPKFKEAERFAQRAPVPTVAAAIPSVMDTCTPEQILLALGKRMGLTVVQTPDPPSGVTPKK